MKDITITFLKSMKHELIEYDHFGRKIPQEKTLEYGLKIPVSFIVDNYKLNSILNVWVPKKNLPPSRHEEFTTSLTIELFPQYIQEINYLNMFDVIDYSPVLRGKHKIKKYENTMYEEVDAVITNELYDHLDKQKEEDRLAKEAFSSAVKILYDFAHHLMPYGFECYANDIKQLLNYLEYCFTNSECLFETAWYQEKLHSLRFSFEELIKRKIANNSNYEYYLRNVQTITYNLEPPHSWRREPPNPHSYGVDEIIKKHSQF
jgi:hypothetical protein